MGIPDVGVDGSVSIVCGKQLIDWMAVWRRDGYMVRHIPRSN
jgi:hypothetical protein